MAHSLIAPRLLRHV
jgi:hypothetical protein